MTYSVIIPLYNKAPHIERAVMSVIRQEGVSFELVVVDDGSTDGGYELVTELAKRDNRIRILRRSPPGPGGYAARNLGAREASANWLAFLDADDEWKPGFLAEIDRIRRSLPEVGCISTSFLVDRGNGDIRLGRFAECERGDQPRIVLPLLFIRRARKGRWPVNSSSVAVSKSILLGIGGFPEGRCARGGDRDTWLRLIVKTSYAWTPYVGSIYHTDSVNMVTRNTVHPSEPCTIQTIQRILGSEEIEKQGRRLRREWMRLYNVSFSSYFRQKRLSGELKLGDIRILYWTVDILFALRVALMALLPRGFRLPRRGKIHV